MASSPNLQLLDGLPDVSTCLSEACICKIMFSPAPMSCLQIKVVLQSGAKSANQVTVIAGKALSNSRQAFNVRQALRRCPVFRRRGRPRACHGWICGQRPPLSRSLRRDLCLTLCRGSDSCHQGCRWAPGLPGGGHELHRQARSVHSCPPAQGVHPAHPCRHAVPVQAARLWQIHPLHACTGIPRKRVHPTPQLLPAAKQQACCRCAGPAQASLWSISAALRTPIPYNRNCTELSACAPLAEPSHLYQPAQRRLWLAGHSGFYQ